MRVLAICLLVVSSTPQASTSSHLDAHYDSVISAWDSQKEATTKKWLALMESTRRYHVEWYTKAKTIIDFDDGAIQIIATGQTVSEATQNMNEAIKTSIISEEAWQDISDETGKATKDPEGVATQAPVKTGVLNGRIVVAKSLPLLSDHRLRRRDMYIDHINFYSQLQGLRPELVTAVIDVESYFNRHAKSKAGAKGLMQLVPKEGGRDAMTLSGRGDRIPTDEELFDPKTNIDLGTTYLKHLMERYSYVRDMSAREYLTLAAYNWGMGNVDIEIRPTSDITSNQVLYRLNAAPKETKEYIRKIREREKVYATL